MQNQHFYIALALSKLQPDLALNELSVYLYNDDAWTRLDATLALSKINESTRELMLSVLSNIDFGDYIGAIIATNINLVPLFNLDDPVIFDGACEVVLGLIDSQKLNLISEFNITKKKCRIMLILCLN